MPDSASIESSTVYVRKLENLEKILVATPPIDSNFTNERLHESIVNTQGTVGMLVANMKSLTQTLGQKSREIAGLKSELAIVKRKSDPYNKTIVQRTVAPTEI
jgi:hypothetical protein